MRLIALKNQLQIEGLLNVHVGSGIKKYVLGESVYSNNVWENMINVFGIYQGNDGRFCFFITDSERGIPEYSAVFATEEEACDALSFCQEIVGTIS
ncbi:MAG: hypothetical protein K6G88_11150 [Lachnospiraceae bacterium]|jgi:hypothetical protein|nr:hypothetical protein [Lachnospiraceae bacterium]